MVAARPFRLIPNCTRRALKSLTFSTAAISYSRENENQHSNMGLNCLETHLSEEQIDSFALGRLDEEAVLHFMICDECMKVLGHTSDFIECLRGAHEQVPGATRC